MISDRMSLRNAAAPARRSLSAVRFAAIGARLQQCAKRQDARDARIAAFAFELAEHEAIEVMRESAATYRVNGMSASAAAIETLIETYAARPNRLADTVAAA